jgi:hypothetical protein
VVILLEVKCFLFFGWALLLLTGLSGCGGTIKTAEYPSTWPQRIMSSSRADCLDISGTYKASNGLPLLPFFLFGITDENSLDWANLIQVYKEHLLADPDGTTVMIGSPDSEHIEVIVAIHGITVARQLLTRSYQSENAAVWFGQHNRSFRCEPYGIVINSSYIHDWDVYSLPYEEKKLRYRRIFGAVGPLGVSEGYFDFSKTTNGSLVARARLYGSYPCESLNEYWQLWEPVLSSSTK